MQEEEESFWCLVVAVLRGQAQITDCDVGYGPGRRANVHVAAVAERGPRAHSDPRMVAARTLMEMYFPSSVAAATMQEPSEDEVVRTLRLLSMGVISRAYAADRLGIPEVAPPTRPGPASVPVPPTPVTVVPPPTPMPAIAVDEDPTSKRFSMMELD